MTEHYYLPDSQTSASRMRARSFLSALTRPVRPLPRHLRVAIVVAHPDDETVGMGAQMSRFADPVLILATDGVPKSMKWSLRRGFAGREEYAVARMTEFRRAISVLGLREGNIISLGLTDQEVVHHIAGTARRLAGLFTHRRTGVVITHAFEGGHPDHDAVAFAAQAACVLMRRRSVQPPALVEAPYYHSRRDRDIFHEFCPIRGSEETHVPLTISQRRTKRQALNLYVTQRELLSRFDIGQERFRRAPRHDFLRVPGDDTPYYERHRLGMTRRRWRDLAASAARQLAEVY